MQSFQVKTIYLISSDAGNYVHFICSNSFSLIEQGGSVIYKATRTNTAGAVPGSWRGTRTPRTDSGGSSGHWRLPLSNRRHDKAPTLTGLKVLLEPQVATHNLQGLTPLLEGRSLPIPHGVWVQPGLARLRGHQGGAVPSPTNSPVPQHPARQNKLRAVMGSAIAWPPPGITPARAETQCSHGKEQGCSRRLQTSLPRGHTHVQRAHSQKYPCHLLFLTITVQLWSTRQAKVYLCALLDGPSTVIC